MPGAKIAIDLNQLARISLNPSEQAHKPSYSYVNKFPHTGNTPGIAPLLKRERVNHWAKAIPPEAVPNLVDIYTATKEQQSKLIHLALPKEEDPKTLLKQLAAVDLASKGLKEKPWTLTGIKAQKIELQGLRFNVDTGLIILHYSYQGYAGEHFLSLGRVPTNPVIIMHRPLDFSQLELLDLRNSTGNHTEKEMKLIEHLGQELESKQADLETRVRSIRDNIDANTLFNEIKQSLESSIKILGRHFPESNTTGTA